MRKRSESKSAKKKPEFRFLLRLRFVLGTWTLLFCCLFGRLFYLQVIRHAYYAGQSDARRLAKRKLTTYRGPILDRRGVVLAEDVASFDVTARYVDLLNPDPWLRSLAKTAGTQPSELQTRIRTTVARIQRIRQRVIAHMRRRKIPIPRTFRIHEEVTRHPVLQDIDFDLASIIETHPDEFPGLRIEPATQRHYERGSLAPHVIGRTVRRDGHTVGQGGVEETYDSFLQGHDGFRVVEVTAHNRIRRIIMEEPPENGASVYLSIDSHIQRRAERALSGFNGAVVVMDCRNGEVLAMATNPRYSNETFSEDFAKLSKDPNCPLLNRPIQATLPCGSVFKVITAAAALQERKISPATEFTCRGTYNYHGVLFRCYSTYGHGTIDLNTAITVSCNIYFFHVAQLLGTAGLINWGRNFGFGKKTGVDLPGERAGVLPTPQWKQAHTGEPWYSGDTLNLAVGQGNLMVTPLQVAVAMAAIANGGTILRPHVVRKIVKADKTSIYPFRGPSEYIRWHIPIDQQNLQIIRQAMRNVVVNGTARGIGLDVINAAGKTGTAQIGHTDFNHAWFAGFAPYDHPRIAFAVALEHVEGEGGTLAAPIAEYVVRYALQRLQHEHVAAPVPLLEPELARRP